MSLSRRQLIEGGAAGLGVVALSGCGYATRRLTQPGLSAHFDVSQTKGDSAFYRTPYDIAAIRRHALGNFRDLLGASARSPAMLYYLDNARNVRGVANENYARELMELHTLGVDGGYSQKDVVEVARAFTGWSVLPPGPARQQAEARLARVQRVGGLGFQEQGDFLFRADIHDAGSKVVLGKTLPAGRGIEDGEQVLDLLAVQPATARHLATQLAARFVADQPPKALVDRLAAVYLESQGDVRQVLRALAGSPEFWSPEARGAKIKSPFELAASAIRAVNGALKDP